MRWTVVEHEGRATNEGMTVFLCPPGGTIGRSPDNQLVLPDEQRRISRLQATVRVDEAGQSTLRNMSAVLPIHVNAQVLQQGDETTIHAGDRVTIGTYVLEAQEPTHRTAAETLPPALALAASKGDTATTVVAPVQPIAISGAAWPADVPDAFADLFGEGVRPIGAPPSAVSPMLADASNEKTLGAAFLSSPEPSVPLASPSAAPVKLSPKIAQPSADDWDSILANAPRRNDGASAPMPDPLAQEPFAQPSQADRNPVDPLTELVRDRNDIASGPLLEQRVDPLSLFAGDSGTPSPLADPRPTTLNETPAFQDEHPATSLLGPSASHVGPSMTDHAREITSQFRPPLPVAPATESGPVKMTGAAPGHLEQEGGEEENHLADLPTTDSAEAVEDELRANAPAIALQQYQTPKLENVAADSSAGIEVALPSLATSAGGDQGRHTPPSAANAASEFFMAFLDGAGVPEVAGQQPFNAESMRRIGRLMRAFIDGTMELLTSRAMLKREVRAEITMIVDEENNPFKILPNGRAVLMQMFGARMPGFLTPEAAVNDALGDLQSHQLGMVAGMRAALLMVLRRFDPETLTRETPHDGSLGEKLLPGGRDVRLWRELRRLHAETAAAVEDDFQAVFGRAFQQAYDKEMERLREARRA